MPLFSPSGVVPLPAYGLVPTWAYVDVVATSAPSRRTRVTCGDIRLNRSGPPTYRVLSRSRTGAVLRHSMQARGRSRKREVGTKARAGVDWRGPTRESGSPEADDSSAAAVEAGWSGPLSATRWELP